MTPEDAERWLEKYRQRNSILKIAKEEGVDPDTVSARLRKMGVRIKQGHHFVEQPPLLISRVMPLPLLSRLGPSA